MGIPEIIAIISLVLFWSGSLVIAWIKLNVELAEIDTKAEQRYAEFKEHCRWGQEEQKRNELKFEKSGIKMDDNHKEMLRKVDYLIEKINELSVYVERTAAASAAAAAAAVTAANLREKNK